MGFRRPSIERELEELGPYVRQAVMAGPVPCGRELARLQRKLSLYRMALERIDSATARQAIREGDAPPYT